MGMYFYLSKKGGYMKTRKLLFQLLMPGLACWLLMGGFSQAQIQVSGVVGENQGLVLWNAGITGAEPPAVGHQIPWTNYGDMYFYGASRDYILSNSNSGGNPPSGFHFSSDITGFPHFVRALNHYGYSPADVTVNLGLFSLGNDTEGEDWFVMGNSHYSNYFNASCIFYLNGEPMLSCLFPYQVVYFSNGAESWNTESSFGGVSALESTTHPEVGIIARAFVNDMLGSELRLKMQLFEISQTLNENGRRGTYYNVRGSLEKGLPNIPIAGLLENHQGLAAWNTDGTGKEPKKTGHQSPDYPTLYYLASRDYDNIDPNPEASLANVVSAGMDGFFNLSLQLAYRGFTPEQLRLTMGLSDLDEDIENEDWLLTSTLNYCNYYRAAIKVMLDGEPLFGVVFDTLKTFISLTEEFPSRNMESSIAYVYDASLNSSDAVQLVAKSFFRDMAKRQLTIHLVSSTVSAGLINSDGRTGAFLQVNSGQLNAVKGPGTILEAGVISGVFTRAGHPYYINGELIVPNGQTLTIEPGVWLKFTDRYLMHIKGRIVAAGNDENTGEIVFTAVNPDRRWGHLMMVDIQQTNGQSQLTHCIFENGYANVLNDYIGSGAIFIANSDNILIDHCIFRNNEASLNIGLRPNGGAIGLRNSSPAISNSVFYNNRARYGGAIDCDMNSSPTISRCVFYNNTGYICSGAILINKESNPTLINNTIAHNISHHFGGGLLVSENSHPELINNILWGNIAPIGSQICVRTGDCSINMMYTDLQSGLEGVEPFGIGTGTLIRLLDEDPLFVDPLADNYLLDVYTPSPCVDAGSPFVAPDPDGSCADIGAYCQTVGSIIGTHPVRLSEVNFSPNPFTGSTSIVFSAPGNDAACVSIYNLVGSKVAEFENSRGHSGEYKIVWDAAGLPGGIYFCRILCGGNDITRKIVKLQ